MIDKLAVFVVQATSDISRRFDLFESGFMLKLLASPEVCVTLINSLEPLKVTMAEHMHLLASRSHIIVVTFDSFNAARQYLLELAIEGEIIDTEELTGSNPLSKTPARKIFLACIDQASDIQKVQSGILQALMVAKDALKAGSANKAIRLPVVQYRGRKNQIDHPFSPPFVFGGQLDSVPMGKASCKAELTQKIADNCYIENLLNDLDNADV